ncbi:hypothetical protein KG090_00525 [Carnobacteriaceae bacterium zg-ZUI240]|nr:hypothetical protein [Carnobacteriaceae bacterium zg-ZUI240]
MNYREFIREMNRNEYNPNTKAIQLMVKVISQKHTLIKSISKTLEMTKDSEKQKDLTNQRCLYEKEKAELIKTALLIGMFEKHLELKFIENKNDMIIQIGKHRKEERFNAVKRIFELARLLIRYITILENEYQ